MFRIAYNAQPPPGQLKSPGQTPDLNPESNKICHNPKNGG